MEINSIHDRLLYKLLSFSNWNIDWEYANKLLISHPSYPSLEAFSETLSYLGIPHEAYIADYTSLLKANLPALLHLDVNEGVFVLLVNINEKEVTLYIPEKNKNIKVTKEVFIKQWSGITLSVAIQMQAKKSRVNLRKLLFIIGIILACIIMSVFYSFVNIPIMLYLLMGISFMGVVLSVFILFHEFGIENEISSEVCGFTEKVDCEAVLSSPASKIFNIISLGDIGLIYFSSNFLMLLIIPLLRQPESYISLLFSLSICALPYSFFSLYYQKVKVGRWCPFCLLVLLMLWLSFICYLPIVEGEFILSGKAFYLWGVLGGVLTALWFFIKPYIFVIQKKKLIDIELLKLKRNTLVFDLFFKNQRIYDMRFDDAEIMLGNLSSQLTVTTLISSKCPYCKKVIKEFLEKNQNENCLFKWVIRFNNSGLVKRDDFLFAEYLSFLYNKKRELFILALTDWANGVDYSRWLKKYSITEVNFEEALYVDRVDWIIENSLWKTPVIFLNNKELPDIYKPSDLDILLINEDIVNLIDRKNSL